MPIRHTCSKELLSCMFAVGAEVMLGLKTTTNRKTTVEVGRYTYKTFFSTGCGHCLRFLIIGCEFDSWLKLMFE